MGKRRLNGITRKNNKKMRKSEKSPNIPEDESRDISDVDDEDRVDYPLCGDSRCLTGHPLCRNMVVTSRNYDEGFTADNIVLSCCFVARLSNENNLRTEYETRKFLSENNYI